MAAEQIIAHGGASAAPGLYKDSMGGVQGTTHNMLAAASMTPQLSKLAVCIRGLTWCCCAVAERVLR